MTTRFFGSPPFRLAFVALVLLAGLASSTTGAGARIGAITEYPLPPQGHDPFPRDITTGPDGNLWFTEIATSAGALGRITPSGIITEFSAGLVQNAGPYDIATGPDGNLWFTDQTLSKIGKATTAGVITEFALPKDSGHGSGDVVPLGITVGPDNNLWFTEENANSIRSIGVDGAVKDTFPLRSADSGQIGLQEIVTGPDNNLWFTEEFANQIGRLTPSGTLSEFALPIANSLPVGIAAGPDGNLWFTENSAGRIGKITPGGVITEFSLCNGCGPNPQDIVAGRDGNLWFTEANGNRIGRVTPSGAITEFAIPTANSFPIGIAAGPDANLWFTEQSAGKIAKINPVDTKAATSTALTSTANPSTAGQTVTFTATVTPPTATGTVQFKDGAVDLGGPVTLSGGSASTSTSTLTDGSHSITALYSGDSDFAASTSATLTQTVRDGPLTATGATHSLTGIEGGTNSPASPVSGTVASFTDADPAGNLGQYTATITWGDSTTSPGTISAAASSGFQVNGSHTYAEDGSYPISITITDIGGAAATAHSTAQVAEPSDPAAALLDVLLEPVGF